MAEQNLSNLGMKGKSNAIAQATTGNAFDGGGGHGDRDIYRNIMVLGGKHGYGAVTHCRMRNE